MNPNTLQYLWGLEFYPSTLMVDVKHIQKRKHRIKRINKKWLKKYGHKTIGTPSSKYYVMGNKIIAHPDMIEKLKKAMNETK